MPPARGRASHPAPGPSLMADGPAPAPLLRIEGLTAGFDMAGRFAPAVSDLSLALQPGETLGLVGESGSGKSVTALSILRLLQPPARIASGRILFRGADLLAMDEREMRRVRGAGIGLVFQEPMSALNPVFTAGDQVAEALVVHGIAGWAEARRRAVDLLAAVRIPDPELCARCYPHQLSGGMRQRVMIAIAIACRPALVIADEPTTALDVTIQAEILDLLRELRDRSGLALLLITHDLGVIAGMADRVAVMYAGRIVEEAPVRRLFHAPQHPYTRGLLAAMPGRASGAPLAAIPGSTPPLGTAFTGCAFEPRCADRIEPCRVARPPLHEVHAGHHARCHLCGTVSVDAAR
jgi:peptide/nickel transport system ATP-binding protein